MSNPLPPCPTPFNLAAYVLGHTPRDVQKIALQIVGGAAPEAWTYEALTAAVFGIAHGLKELGLSDGDRVLLRLSNRVEFPLSYLGAIAAGLVPVPTSAHLTQPEITKISAQVCPALIIADTQTPLPYPCNTSLLGLEDLRKMMCLQPLSPVLGDPDRLGYIIFTSGTSGNAKGVCHAHRAIWARQMMWKDWYGISSSDRVMHAGAFNWTYTLGTGLMDPWSVGATAVIPAPDVSPNELPQLIAEFDVTIFAAAPGIYRQALRAMSSLKTPNLRHGLSAGEKLPATIAEEWHRKTGTLIHESLGMSEVSTFVSGSPERPAPLGTSGYAQTGRQIAILNAVGQRVAKGEPGELAISINDPGLMIGYLDEPKLTEPWFTTGDIVSHSEDGAISYLGRSDDMMNAGGFRVSPLEVEAAFADQPDMKETAATSVEIKADTWVIALFYTAPVPIENGIMRAHAQARLAQYKQPRLYIHRVSLPKGPNGKMSRKQLRAEFGVKDG